MFPKFQSQDSLKNSKILQGAAKKTFLDRMPRGVGGVVHPDVGIRKFCTYPLMCPSCVKHFLAILIQESVQIRP